MKDAFGRELKVGDQVVYASRYGSSVDLKVLVVLQVTHKKEFGKNKLAVRCRPISGVGKEQLYGVPALLVKLQEFKTS